MKALSNTSRWIPVLMALVMGTLCTVLLHQHEIPWSDAIIDGGISGAVFGICIAGGMITVSSYPTKVGIAVYALIAGIATGFIAWYFDMLILKWWFDDELYKTTMLSSSWVRLVIAVLASCWAITFAATKRRMDVLESQFRNNTDASALHREAELFKLRQQLQPHFLYNSLNSISALIMIEPDKAQEMIGRLSDFLRNSVKREGREQIPVEEELQYIEAYLAIESVRFGDRLKLSYSKSFTDTATIPPFLLQPLLENAIKFGLYGQTGEVEIKMQIGLQGNDLVVTISNPFDPSNRPASGTGFGLTGVQRRLYLLFARNDLLETSQQDHIFSTTLKIPQAHA